MSLPGGSTTEGRYVAKHAGIFTILFAVRTCR
jgi:hypothetical protein